MLLDTRTPFAAAAEVSLVTPGEPSFRESLRGRIPLGRMGESVDVAQAFLYLASHGDGGRLKRAAVPLSVTDRTQIGDDLDLAAISAFVTVEILVVSELRD